MIMFLEFSRPVPEEVTDALTETAYLMMCMYQRRRTIRHSECEGVVRTTFRTIALAGTAGIDFTANVTYDAGESIVRFFVRPQDLSMMETTDTFSKLTLSQMLCDQALEHFKEHARPNPIKRVRRACN